MKTIEERIQKIEERNKSVEGDKAWEVSLIRRLLLAIFTYAAIAIYMWAIDISQPYIHAIVPAIAFVLSTLTLPFFKKIWLRMK